MGHKYGRHGCVSVLTGDLWKLYNFHDVLYCNNWGVDVLDEFLHGLILDGLDVSKYA